jgi:poly-gamma-glutamate capsule biosynthesis protein CapA/YwtB (metallophosphatase superfamily)
MFSSDTEDKIKIIITGDLCPHLRIEKLCMDGQYEKIYNDVLPRLRDKDLSITNIECPLTNRINPINKSGPHLSAKPQSIGAITYGGFNIAALANNHIMDQDYQGLIDTIAVCSNAGIRTVGAGDNLQKASKPLYITIKNKTIAILNFAEEEFSIAGKNTAGANPLNLIDSYHSIQDATQHADILLVIVHGGHEGYPLPSPRMVQTYRFFAELGATVVVGHHTHRASGYEIYNGAPIFYSLGNFIFDSYSAFPDYWYEGYFVELELRGDGDIKFDIVPYEQCKSEPGMHLMRTEQRNSFLNKIDDYSKIIQNDTLLEARWREFCDSRAINYLSWLLRLNRVESMLLKIKLMRKYLFRATKKMRILQNLFTCESHRDIVIKTFKGLFKEE